MDKRKRRLSSKMKDLEEEEESDESAESLILKQKCQKLLKIRVDGPGRKNIFADVEENPRKIRRSIVKRALRNVISSTPMPAKANEHFFSTECSLNISPIPPENSDNSPKKDTKKTNEDKKLDVITVSSDSEDVATSPKKGKEEQAPKMHTRSQSRKLGEKRSPNQMKNTEQSDLNAIKREEEVILNTNESHIDRHEITKSFVNHTESNSIEKSTKVARNAFKSPRSAKNISKSLHSTKNHSKASDSSKLKSTEKHKVGGNISNLTESRKRSALRSNLSKSLHHVKSYVESSCRSQSESDEESHEIGKKIMKSPRDIPNKSYSKCLSPIKEFQNCYRTRTEEWVKQIEDNSKNNVTLRKNGSQVVQSLVRERPEVRDEASEKVSRIPVFRTRSKSREKVDKSEPESSKENKPNENKIVSSPPKPAPRMKKKAKAGLTELSANINSMGVQVEDDEVPQKPAPEIGNSPKTKNTDKCLVDVGTSPNLLENPTSPAKNRLDSKSESKQVPELVLSPRAKRSLILNTFENRSISIDSKKVMRKNTSCSSFNTNSTSSDDKETKRKRLDLLLSSIVEKQKKSQSSPIVEGSKEHSNSILEGNSRTQHTQFQIPGVVIQKASSTIKSCARNIFTKTITEREGKTTAKNNVQNKKLVDIDHEDSLSSTNSSKMLEKYYDHSIHPKHSSKGALFNSLEEGPPVLEWHSRTESFNITEHVNDRVPWRFEQQLPRRSSYLPRLNFLRSAEEIECDKQSLSRKRLENEFDTSISITDESARDIDYIDETQNKEIKKKKRLKSTFRDYTHKSIRNMAETHRDTEEDISESCSSIFAESHNNIEQTSDHSKGSVESHLEQANDEKKAESEENTLTEDLDLHIEKQSNEYILATAQTSNKVHKASKNNSKLKKYTTKSFENEDNENVSTNSEEETDNEVISNVEKKQIDEDILGTSQTRIKSKTKNNSELKKYREQFVAENEDNENVSTNSDEETEVISNVEKKRIEKIMATPQTRNKDPKASKNNSKSKKYKKKSLAANEKNENASTNSEEEMDNSNVEKQQIDGAILVTPRTRIEVHKNNSKFNKYKEKFVAENEEDKHLSTNADNEEEDNEEQINEQFSGISQTRNKDHKTPKNDSKFKKYKKNSVARNEENENVSTNADNEEKDHEVTSNVEKNQINEEILGTPQTRNKVHEASKNDSKFKKPKEKSVAGNENVSTKADNEEKDNEVTSNVEKKQIVGEISGTVQTRNRVHRASKNNSKSKKCKEKSVAGNENDDNEKKDNEVSSNIEKKQINEEIAGTPQTRNKTHKASKNDSKFKKYKEKSVAENEEDKDVSTKEKKENGVISKAEEATNISKLQKTVEIQSYQKEFEKQNSENTNRGEPSHRSNASMKQKHLYNEVENVINESPNSSHRSCLQVEVENVLEISNCKTHESPIEKSGSYHLTNISQGSNLEMELENVPKMNEKEPVPLLTVDTVKSPKKSLRKSRPEEVLDKSLKRRKIIKKPVNSSSDDDFEKNGVVEPTCSETQSKLTVKLKKLSESIIARKLYDISDKEEENGRKKGFDVPAMPMDEDIDINANEKTPAKKTKTDLTNKKDTFKVPKQKNGTVSSVISEIEDASDDTSLGGIRRSTRQRKPPTRRYLLGIPGRIDACSFTKRSSSVKKGAKGTQSRNTEGGSKKKKHPEEADNVTKEQRTEMSTLKRSKRGAKQNEGGTVVTVAQIHTNTAVNDEHKTDSASSSDNLVHYGRDQMSQDLDEDNFLRVPDTHTVNQYSLTGSMRTINSFDVSGLRTTQVSSKVKKSNRKKKDITDIISVVSEDVAGKEKNETEMAHHERSITRNLLAGESEYEIVKQKYLGNNYQFQICQDDFSISNFIRINNGATMGYLQLPAKGMKPLHLTKKHTLCYIVMEGEGRIQIDNDILRVGKTDNFTIPLGSEYAIMNDSSDAMILACIKLAS